MALAEEAQRLEEHLGMANGIRQLYAIMLKDYLVDMRRRTELGGVIVFSVASGIASSYLVIRGSGGVGESIGVLLVAVFLAVFASLASFVREYEQGTLDAVRLAPVSPEILFIAKTMYSFMFIALQLVVYLLTVSFFGQRWGLVGVDSVLLALITSAYLSGVSSLASAILVYSEAKGVLLPVTVLVLVLPFLQNIGPLYLDVFRGVGVNPAALLGVAGTAAAFIALTILLSRYVLEAL